MNGDLKAARPVVVDALSLSGTSGGIPRRIFLKRMGRLRKDRSAGVARPWSFVFLIHWARLRIESPAPSSRTPDLKEKSAAAPMERRGNDRRSPVECEAYSNRPGRLLRWRGNLFDAEPQGPGERGRPRPLSGAPRARLVGKIPPACGRCFSNQPAGARAGAPGAGAVPGPRRCRAARVKGQRPSFACGMRSLFQQGGSFVAVAWKPHRLETTRSRGARSPSAAVGCAPRPTCRKNSTGLRPLFFQSARGGACWGTRGGCGPRDQGAAAPLRVGREAFVPNGRVGSP